MSMLGTRTILLVEDCPQDAIFIARALESPGLDVRITRVESREALHAALGTRTFDVILSDYMLPGFDALQVLADTLVAGVEAPIIVLTGAVGEERAAACIRAGAYDFLLKSHLERLGALVERAMRETETMRAHRAAEAARRRTEQRMLQLAENIPDVYWVRSRDTGQFTFVSPAFERLWCRTIEDLLKDPAIWFDAIDPADRNRVAAAVAREPQETYLEEYRILRPDGSRRWIRDRTFPSQAGSPELAGMATDVTDIKRDASRLQAKAETGRLLAESLSMAEILDRALDLLISTLEWDFAALWQIDEPRGELRLLSSRTNPEAPCREFDRVSRELGFRIDDGLPGMVWRTAAPVWVEEVRTFPGFLRGPQAAADELRSACILPIILDGQVSGHVELFCREARRPDEEMMQLLGAIGNQIGHFVHRRQADQRMQLQAEVATILAQDVSPDEALGQVLECVCRGTRWDAGAVWRPEPEGRFVCCTHFWSPLAEGIVEFETSTRALRFPPGAGLPGRVWQSGRPCWIHDVTRDDDFTRLPAALQAGLHGAMGFPIQLENQVLGVLEFFSREQRQPEAGFVPLVHLIGSQLAQFLHRVQSQQELEVRSGQQGLIARIGTRALSCAEIDPLLEDAVRDVASGLGIEPCAVWLLAPDGLVTFRTGVGWHPGIEGQEFSAREEGSFMHYAFNRRELVILRDLGQETRFPAPGWMLDHGIQSGIAVPIEVDQRQCGLLGAFTRKRRTFNGDELMFVEAVTNILGNAMARTKSERELRTRARLAGFIGEVNASLNRKASLEEHLRSCAATIVEHLDAAFARIWVISGDKNCLELRASAGMYTHIDGPHSRVPVGALEIGRIAKEREPHLTNSVTTDSWVGDPEWARREKMVAFAGYPLVAGDELVGVMAMFSRAPLDESTLQAMASVAGSIALAIHGSRAADALEESRMQFLQSQKLEAIGRLAGGVAHDFNNMLSVILGNTELALEDLSADDPGRELLITAMGAGQRAAGLTRQLLAFSRRQLLQPQVIDLGSLVSNLENMLRRLIGEDVTMRVERGAQVGRVSADPGQIEQVVLNLVVNARDAMPRGGTLIIGIENVEREWRAADRRSGGPRARFVELSVSDTGDGIPPEMLERIFEPFFTTKPRERGTGLGLSTVHGIVQQSGGEIEVQSVVGRGTTFRIFLPRVDAGEESRSAPPVGMTSSTGKQRILVVEDQVEVRSLATMILRRSGYHVLEADSAEQALEICSAPHEEIHMLLTDVVMPGMSGPELVARLAHVLPDMRVLMMSGYTDDAMVHHRAIEANFPLLEKPFTPASLTGRVAAVLGDANARRAGAVAAVLDPQGS